MLRSTVWPCAPQLVFVCCSRRTSSSHAKETADIGTQEQCRQWGRAGTMKKEMAKESRGSIGGRLWKREREVTHCCSGAPLVFITNGLKGYA